MESVISSLDQHITHYLVSTIHQLECNKELQTIFIDYLTELLTEVVSNHNSIIILGDINIHLNEPEDTDTKALCDTLEAFNIKQHIKFPTHNLGHTLDIITTEIGQNRMVTTIPEPYIYRSSINCCLTQRQKPQNRMNEIE